MKRIIIFVFSVWVIFLLPFLVLSSHFINSVKNMSITTTLYKVDAITSSISYQISSILENEYNIFFNFDKKNPTQKELIDFLKKKKGPILRGFVVLDLNLNEIYNFEFGKVSSYNQILANLKKVDIPLGIVEYPQDKPAEIVVGSKVGGFYVLYRCDLGYLISKITGNVSKIEGDFYFIDDGFNVIYDSSDNYIMENVEVVKEIVDLTKNLIKRSNFNYRGIIKINNKDHILSLYNVENTRWWVYTILDISKIKDPLLFGWAKRVILIGIVLIFVFSVITYFLAKKMLKV